MNYSNLSKRGNGKKTDSNINKQPAKKSTTNSNTSADEIKKDKDKKIVEKEDKIDIKNIEADADDIISKRETADAEAILNSMLNDDELTDEEREFREEYVRWLKQCYIELIEAGKEFTKLGMKVTVHNVSVKNSLPVLVIVLRENGSELLAVDLSFSPFERQSLKETKWLQMGVEFPWDILSQDQPRFLGLLNKINSYIPVGHFSLIDEVMYYRFVCSIPKKMKASALPVLESISVISVFAANYEEVFRNYLTKKITFTDLYNIVTESLN